MNGTENLEVRAWNNGSYYTIGYMCGDMKSVSPPYETQYEAQFILDSWRNAEEVEKELKEIKLELSDCYKTLSEI